MKPAAVADRPTTRVAAVVIAPAEPPSLLHLPGIGGVRTCDVAMAKGLKAGGFLGDIGIYSWTGDEAGLTALWGKNRHRQQARIVADRLTAAFDQDPRKPLMLSGHSGGAGIAVWALELLPDRVTVRTLLLLEPAVSPTYDLSKALRHVADRAYVFSSVHDPVVGLGCRVMGTMDGPKVFAAGNVGFSRPPAADAAGYAKLVSVPYNPDWVRLDNGGDHVGPLSRAFSQAVLAPLLLHDVVPPAAAPDRPTTRPTG